MATMWWKYLCLNLSEGEAKNFFSASPGCFAQNSVIFKAFWNNKVKILSNRLIKNGQQLLRQGLSSLGFEAPAPVISHVRWCLKSTEKPARCGRFQSVAIRLYGNRRCERGRSLRLRLLWLTQRQLRVDILREARHLRQPIRARRSDTTRVELVPIFTVVPKDREKTDQIKWDRIHKVYLNGKIIIIVM